jgi:hypothetical protein
MSIAAEIAALRFQIESLKKQKAEIEGYAEEAETQIYDVWCVDLGEITVGSIVGLIEIDSEINGGINIMPAETDGAVYDKDRDGISIYNAIMDPIARFYNMSIGPGKEKWYPRFRYGELYNKIDDTASIKVSPYTSSMEPDIDLNIKDTLYSVPIEYPPCNGGAFVNGDIVVVSFTDNDWNQPKVIGFKDHPKSCGQLVFVQFGIYGILWDVEIDTYHIDFPGIQFAVDIETFLAAKTDLTVGMPYEYALRRRYYSYTPDPIIPAFGFITRPLAGFSSDPGWLCEGTRTGPATSPPYRGPFLTPWGTLRDQYFYDDYYLGSTKRHFSSFAWNYGQTGLSHALVCGGAGGFVGDDDWTHYGFNADGTPVIAITPTVGGNYSGGYDYTGSRYSDQTLVQIVFDSAIDITAGLPTSIYDTQVHACCNAYPWDDGGGGETSDPVLQPLNTLFSDAMKDLIDTYITANFDPNPSNMTSYSSYFCGPDFGYILDAPEYSVKIYNR